METSHKIMFGKNNNNFRSSIFVYIVALFIGIISVPDIFAQRAGSALTEQEAQPVYAMIFNVLSDNREAVANHIKYPLGRRYPLPSIKNKNEFLSYYDIIFTDEFKQELVEYDHVEWMGGNWYGHVSICESLMCGDDYDGVFKINEINYESPQEKKLWDEAIEKRKARLHPSVRSFINPIRIYKTKRFTIMIDEIAEDVYRYVSWKAGKSLSDTPDLILGGGELELHGTMLLRRYVFTNDIYKYIITPIGFAFDSHDLEVYKGDTLILSDDIISSE